MVPFDRSHASSYSSSIVTMAVSLTVFEIKRDIGKNDNFSYRLVLNLHDPIEFFEFLPKILTQTVRVFELLGGSKILPKSSSLCLGCNNVTDDRQMTDGRLMP